MDGCHHLKLNGMEIPLLQTKLYIPPPRPDLVPRPRLIELLDEGLGQSQVFGRKLTLVSAPAGFGKTTLVSSWIYDLQAKAASQEKIVNPKPVLSEAEVSKIVNQVAWLSLDEGDNDLTRFLAYLVAALQTLVLSGGSPEQSRRVEGIAANIREGVLGVLHATQPQPPPIESILTTLINEIATIAVPPGSRMAHICVSLGISSSP